MISNTISDIYNQLDPEYTMRWIDKLNPDVEPSKKVEYIKEGDNRAPGCEV